MADKEFLSPVTLAVLKLKNTANTFTNLFSNATTAARTWTFPDKSGTIAITDDLTDLAKLIYPVGIIVRLNVSTNPATLFGFGTWTLHGAGRVGVCIDTNQTEFNTLGKTGGEKTHLLTSNESGLRAHNHAVPAVSGAGTAMWGVASLANPVSSNIATYNSSALNALEAHNNLQPYIVEYVWVRTA